jgi:predicted amidohydrolase
VRIGFFQFAPQFGAREANLAKVESALAGATADLVVLPELFNTGYCFGSRTELSGLAEDLTTGPTVTRLQLLADRAGIAIAAGIAERGSTAGSPGLFNSAVLLAPDHPAPLLTYRKVHLFGKEKELFDPGDRPPAIAVFREVKVGLEVCFDHFFPELTRALVRQGAQLVCHPANLVLHYAQQTTVTRALENGIFWILCNRIGTETRADQALTFTGRSQIVAPRGQILATAGREEEVIKVVDIDPDLADDKEIFTNNDLLKDRRPELYDTGG